MIVHEWSIQCVASKDAGFPCTRSVSSLVYFRENTFSRVQRVQHTLLTKANVLSITAAFLARDIWPGHYYHNVVSIVGNLIIINM